MEIIGASMAVKTSWVDTDADAHKGIYSITSGINALMKMNVPILTHVALLLATTHLEVTSVPALLDFLMTNSPVHAMM